MKVTYLVALLRAALEWGAVMVTQPAWSITAASAALDWLHLIVNRIKK